MTEAAVNVPLNELLVESDDTAPVIFPAHPEAIVEVATAPTEPAMFHDPLVSPPRMLADVRSRPVPVSSRDAPNCPAITSRPIDGA